MDGGSVISPSETKRALHLYELALSLVEAKGVLVTLGVSTFREYRAGNLIIHHLPSLGRLNVWYRRKVLTIDRLRGALRVTGYKPGRDWEDELEAAAAKSLSKG
jgi:hypothetical protein